MVVQSQAWSDFKGLVSVALRFRFLSGTVSDGCVAVACVQSSVEVARGQYRSVSKFEESCGCNEYGQEKARGCVGRLFACTE